MSLVRVFGLPVSLIFLDFLVPLVSLTLASSVSLLFWVSSVSVSVLNNLLLSVTVALL